MSYSLRLSLLLALSGGMLLAPVAPSPAAADQPAVRAIRYSTTPGRVRLVLDLSVRSAFTVDLLPDSSGISVVVPGATLDCPVRDVAVGRYGVSRIQAHADESRTEVVVLVERGVAWEEFSLPAEGGKPFRVVVDVTEPDTGVAPPREVPPAPEPAPARAFVVAIDAGHGGHDAGTLGKYGLVEKKMCLDVARRIAAILERQPGIRVVLTRESDEYLTLPRRNEVAEEKGADVFVSIHMNSAPRRSARGAEIYFVAPAGAERAASQAFANGEAAHDFGLNATDDGDIVHMLLDVNQQAVLARSELLAEAILESVRGRNLLPTRTVKQKSFSVLRTISMPSVLVEAGFISNDADARLIRDPDGRERIARAIADGIVEFSHAHPAHRGGGEVGRNTVHRVQRGDTLWTISRLYDTTVERLRQLNGLGSRNELRVGQEIVVRTR